MYDYFKGWVFDRLLINEFLKHRNVREINYPTKFDYNGLNLIVRSPILLEINGSLHKYFTQSDNASDFNIGNINEAINSITNDINIPANKIKIINLEFGVNLRPEMPVEDIINNIVSYKGRSPNFNYYGKRDSTCLEFQMTKYYLKIYHKGIQANKGNILRIELKYMTSQLLTSIGIRNMNDLRNKDLLHTLKNKLCNSINNIIFDDPSINSINLPDRKRNLYLTGSNPRFWKNKIGKNHRKLNYRKKQFNAIIKEYGRNDYRTIINQLIICTS